MHSNVDSLELIYTNVKWPNIVKNEDGYRKTATTEWSNIIRKRSLKWFRKVIKVIRADESTK